MKKTEGVHRAEERCEGRDQRDERDSEREREQRAERLNDFHFFRLRCMTLCMCVASSPWSPRHWAKTSQTLLPACKASVDERACRVCVSEAGANLLHNSGDAHPTAAIEFVLAVFGTAEHPFFQSQCCIFRPVHHLAINQEKYILHEW